MDKGCRDGFGDALLELGKNKNIVALSADLGPSVRTNTFKKKYPKRTFDVGVAEQNLVTIASGLAHVGKIPFAASFGAFNPGRNWEQIRTTIAYNNNNVKIIASHCGLDVGPDGATHQVLEDIALMRSLPNMAVVVPADYNQAKAATKAFAKRKGPCYMRFGRSKTPVFTKKFTLGKADVLTKGNKIALIACGPLVHTCLEVAKKKKGIRVINCHTIKPIDAKTIQKAARECKKIVTVEDHQIQGGLGSAVMEVIAEKPKPVYRIGVKDKFGESGSSKELYEKHGLDADGIFKTIRKYLK